MIGFYLLYFIYLLTPGTALAMSDMCLLFILRLNLLLKQLKISQFGFLLYF